jgi:hypothetical protein
MESAFVQELVLVDDIAYNLDIVSRQGQFDLFQILNPGCCCNKTILGSMILGTLHDCKCRLYPVSTSGIAVFMAT